MYVNNKLDSKPVINYEPTDHIASNFPPQYTACVATFNKHLKTIHFMETHHHLLFYFPSVPIFYFIVQHFTASGDIKIFWLIDWF